MNRTYDNQHTNAFEATIDFGMRTVRGLSGGLTDDTGSRTETLAKLRQALDTADAVVVGAGAGLSASAGFVYSGERFQRYFFDFAARFGIRDMYSGGFYPFPDAETRWAWWARLIYFNRYVLAPKPVYDALLRLTEGKNLFVITTNVDHQFQRAGFDKSRLFYTQGDYGLFQPVSGTPRETYDNEDWVMRAMEAQRFLRDENGVFRVPPDRQLAMRLPHDLIPVSPADGGPVTLNLRSDDTFVEDAGWQRAAARYGAFLRENAGKRVLFLELGVGANTPVIIKYPFWAMTAENPDATYACLNFGEAFCPEAIRERSLLLDGDIGEILSAL